MNLIRKRSKGSIPCKGGSFVSQHSLHGLQSSWSRFELKASPAFLSRKVDFESPWEMFDLGMSDLLRSMGIRLLFALHCMKSTQLRVCMFASDFSCLCYVVGNSAIDGIMTQFQCNCHWSREVSFRWCIEGFLWSRRQFGAISSQGILQNAVFMALTSKFDVPT